MALKYDQTQQLSAGISVSSSDTYVGSPGYCYQEVSDTEEQTASGREGRQLQRRNTEDHAGLQMLKSLSLSWISLPSEGLGFALIWQATIQEPLSLPSAVCCSSFSFWQAAALCEEARKCESERGEALRGG